MSVLVPEKSPLISIIVPVYNVEPYLRRCIDSILEQTYSKLEIIIVASTSSDNSVEICEEYEKRDSRIILIHSDPKGLSDARNKGIVEAQGEYLSFIDSDDYVHPEYISKLYTALIQNDCDISQCFYEAITTLERDTHPINQKADIQIYSGKEMCSNLYLGCQPRDVCSNIASWGKLYKSSLFTFVKFPIGKINEDQATTYLLFYLSKKVGIISDKLYYYSSRETSIMGQPFSLKRLDDLEFVEIQLSFFKEKKENKLYGLCLTYYLTYINDNLDKIKCYFPKEKCLISKLFRKKIKTIFLIIVNKNIPLIWKGTIIFIHLFPFRFINVFSNVGWMRKILNAIKSGSVSHYRETR